MTSKSPVPDYDLDDRMELASAVQVRAIGHPLRTTILGLLHERAATVTRWPRPSDGRRAPSRITSTCCQTAGLVRVVRTRRVRAIDERYYGRTARMFHCRRRVAPARWGAPVGFQRLRRCRERVAGGVPGPPAVVIHPACPDSTRARRRVLATGHGSRSGVRASATFGRHHLRIRRRDLPDPRLSSTP